MEKLKCHTPDFTAENIQKLAALFPNCVVEAKDAQGKPTKAIDFDQLRQELAASVVEGPRERYHLDWPGKREALLAANAPIARTLRPSREESVDFDTTKNLFIEGDNLDALKLLQETFLGKVKMIYIDPPYNTGSDFVYDDDFSEDTAAFFSRSNQKDSEGNRLVMNPESNGRFHSVWLTMMYPRLKLARNLLREDGVIFISIDDGELDNLRKLCGEIFGEENFICQICIVSNPRGRQSETVATTHEYLLCFARDAVGSVIQGQPLSEQQLKDYTFTDPSGRKYRTRGLRHRGNASRRVDRPNMFYPFFVNPSNREVSLERSDAFCVEVLPRKSTGEDGRWEWGAETARGRLGLLEGVLISGRNEWDIFQREFLDDETGETRTTKWKSVWDEKEINYQNGKTELKALFGEAPFDYPKPLHLLRKVISGSSSADDIIVDFFGGSGTTGHAVFEANVNDGGERRFILVQMPENLDQENGGQKAAIRLCDQLGRPHNIAELCKERLRRAGRKLREDNSTSAPHLDVGFRVLRIDTSNMMDVYYAPDSIKQSDLVAHADNIKEDRTAEDLLFQVLVDWGVDLALPISKEIIAGKSVFFVDGNALAACFDAAISEDLVKELARRKPLRAVFRDSSYGSDSVKINVEQIFKLLSPTTEIKSL